MKSEAYLWQHKNGYWYVLYWTDPPNSRKRMETLKTKDRRIAEDRLFLWRQQRAQEKLLGIRQVGVPLRDAVEEYLKHFGKRNKAVSEKRYRNALNNVLEFLGDDLPLGALEAKALQDYQLHRVAQDADERTVDYELDAMRAFLSWCRKRNWVFTNLASAEHVERLLKKRDRESDKRIFTDKELETLLTKHEGVYWQYQYVFVTLYYTGLRIGELSHLTVKDVDVNRLEIQVRDKRMKIPVWDPETKRLKVQQIDWTPKWYEKRVVPIESRLEPILREFHEIRMENIWGLYFYGTRGTPITDHIGRTIKSLTDKTDVSAHTFRHTHISHALNRWGRHPSVVMRWVGHRDLKTTQKYLHVSTEDLHREAGKTGQ